MCFVGVARAPWNLYLRAHNEFVVWAFRAFLAGALRAAVATGITASFPRRFTWIFGSFALLLSAYVGLLITGPKPHTAAGAFVQATGQTIMVDASVLTILVASASIAPIRPRAHYSPGPPTTPFFGLGITTTRKTAMSVATAIASDTSAYARIVA